MDEDIELYKNNPIIQKQLQFVNDLIENHKEIAKSITKYTDGEKIYMILNTNLLRKKHQPKEIQVHLDNIDEAFKAVPPLTEPLVVYRGKKQDEVREVDPSFVSTSLFSDVTLIFTGVGCCVLKITVSPGSKVLPIYDLSKVRHEFEILLDRGGQFIVTGSEINRYISGAVESKSIKTIFVTYTPKIFEQTTLLSEIVDPEKLDETQIQESVIAYFIGMKISYQSVERFDFHLNKLMEEEKLTLSSETINAIKMRLGVSKSCVVRSKEMICAKEVPNQFPDDIIKLTIENITTPITTILPNNLTVLIFKYNSVPLPELPASLEVLHCKENKLTFLPPIEHSNLKLLNCEDNSLTELPVLPSTLEVLRCDNNKLTILPDLSQTKLIVLKCNYNFLTELPLLPSTLEILHCRSNKLTFLPDLSQTKLTDLKIRSNFIKELPPLPERWTINFFRMRELTNSLLKN